MSAIVKASSAELAHESSITAELPAIFQLARELMQAKGFIPSHLHNPGQIAAVILAGRELGLAPMTSLRNVILIEGKVGLDASMQLALMLRAGISHEWLADGSNGVAKLRLERPGKKPHEHTYTMDDAKRAGLAGKSVWQKYPAAMLRARCVSAAARAFAPDVLSGVYVPEELDEMRGAYDARPRGATPVQPPAYVEAQHEPEAAEPTPHLDMSEPDPLDPEPPCEADEAPPSPAECIKMLVETDLKNCRSRDQLIAWARALDAVPADTKAKASAWKAFQAQAMLTTPNIDARELVNAARAA